MAGQALLYDIVGATAGTLAGMRERGPLVQGAEGGRGMEGNSGRCRRAGDTYLYPVSLASVSVRSRGNVSERPTQAIWLRNHQPGSPRRRRRNEARHRSFAFATVNRLKAYPPGMYLTSRDRIFNIRDLIYFSFSLSFLDSHSSFVYSRRFNWNLVSTWNFIRSLKNVFRVKIFVDWCWLMHKNTEIILIKLL